MKTPLRFARACALLASAAALRGQAVPPPSAAGEPALKMEAVSVTGSFLKRVEQEKALPLTVLSGDDVKLRAVSTPAELFAFLPEAGRIPVSESGNGGAGIRGDVSTVSLRSLGSGNTLVLLNGRRLAPHPITGPEGGAPFLSVNTNVIPTAAVAGLEILRDGASAIYGTDASAGVVNTLLRRNVTGTELSLRYADTQHGGAREMRGTLTTGTPFAKGAGSVVLIYDWFDRSALLNTDRAFSRTADQRRRAPAPWNGTTTDTAVDFRSAHGFFGRFQRGTIGADGAFGGGRPAGGFDTAAIAANGTFYFVPTAPGAPTRTWQAAQPDQSLASPVYEHFYDINRYQMLLPESKRQNLYLSGDYKLTARVQLFGDITLYRAKSRNQREGTRVDNFVDNNVLVSRDNPYNPFGSRFYSPTGAPNADGTARLTGAPSDVLIGRQTLQDVAPRVINVDSNARRAVLGARGDLTGAWRWESAFLYSAARTEDHEDNSVKENQFRDAVARTDATAYNPFNTTFAIVNGQVRPTGNVVANPQAIIDRFLGTFVHEGETTLGSWDLRVNGDLFPLPGGPLAIAAGGELRRETFLDYRDPESGRLSAADVQRLGYRASLVGDNNYLQQSPTDNADAHRDVQAAFVELSAPLFGARNAMPGARSLDVTFAARYENYSDFGSTTKPKVGLAWRPATRLMVRASFNKGFRAPNLASLFSGNVTRAFQNAVDNYRFPVTGLIDDGTGGRRRGIRAGNRNLTPENAETRTAGLVLDVPGVKGLSVSADWWKIEQTDSIALVAGTLSLIDDAARLLAENNRQIAAGRAPAQIDLSAAGNSYVVRNAVTQADRDAFAAYNATRPAAQQRAPIGSLRVINEPYINASGRELQGIDLSVDYRLPRLEAGQFHFNVAASWLGKNDFRQDAATPVQNQRWLDGRAKWKGNVSVQWRRDLWSGGLFGSYLGSYRDGALRTTAIKASYLSSDGYYIVRDDFTLNAHLARRFTNGLLRDTTVRLGMNNVFDREPPFAADNTGTALGSHDPRGRAFYAEVSRKF
ncbi:MAG: TonB-dependent receptor [Opitutaceae bacterium]|nr:TonB-dependent receptor [Opitutaceae bacterium]